MGVPPPGICTDCICKKEKSALSGETGNCFVTYNFEVLVNPVKVGELAHADSKPAGRDFINPHVHGIVSSFRIRMNSRDKHLRNLGVGLKRK